MYHKHEMPEEKCQVDQIIRLEKIVKEIDQVDDIPKEFKFTWKFSKK